MSKITLTSLANLQNDATATAQINANSVVVQTAMDNTLSRDGTQPNQMASQLDMNSNRIINLPTPLSSNEPATLGMLNSATIGSGNLPIGGSVGQILTKNSSTNYDTSWTSESASLVAGTNILVSGTSPATVSTVTSPTFTAVNKVAITAPATAATLTIANGKTLTANNTLALSGTDATTMTFPATSATIARTDAANTFTGHQTIEGVTSTGATGTGNLVFSTSPTFTTPLLGTPTSGVATNLTGTAAGLTAGNVTTNANLTGVITSSGNATSIASQTGTGSTFVTSVSPALTGTPTAPTAAVNTNTTQLATTAMVLAQASSTTPVIDGTATIGVATTFARADHIHPTDTTRQAADPQLFSNIPQNSQSAAYGLILTDGSKHILHPTADNSARTFTIPANASVAYPIGTVLTFVNQINTVTIAITTDTMTLAGVGTTGSRTLAANGIATALKIASTSWIISGTGLT